MKPIIMPFAGIGPVILGTPSDKWLDVRKGDTIISATRLPGGRCILPLTGGPITVRKGSETIAATVIDPRLVPEFGPGPYEVRGPGTLHVWQYDGDMQHGLLAGGPPLLSGENRLDLSKLPLPHGSLRLAVQVRAGRSQGPVQFVLYQPSPKPARITVDHDVGGLGPRTHLVVDPAGLAQLEVTVERRIRQTGQTVSDPFVITPDENRITFDDLLHGDRLIINVNAPHALSDEGRPVGDLEYRYHAVPEPRLERAGGGGPVDFQAGIAPMPAREVVEALRAAFGGMIQPTWHEEFPNATKAQRLDTLPQALHDAGITDPVTHIDALRWWLGVLEAGQNVHSARRLRTLRLVCAPNVVNPVAQAADFLKEFPAHIFTELDADAAIASKVLQFQERLGIADQQGDAVLRLMRGVREQLETAANGWAKRLRNAGVHWLDGAIAPLDGGPDIAALRSLIVSEPGKAVATLRTARQSVWQMARTSGATLADPDLEARQALLTWHLERSTDVLARLGQRIHSAGFENPAHEVADINGLTRVLGDVQNAADAAIARVTAVPITGPVFVKDAAGEGHTLAEEIHAALGAWTGARVPPAVRAPAQRLLETLNADAVARLNVWHHFLQVSEGLVHNIGILATTAGDIGLLAKHVEALFADAHGRRDPLPFAEAIEDFERIETSLVIARDAWQHAISDCSDATYDAIGLSAGAATPWDSIRTRIIDDAAQIRNLGHLLEGQTGEKRLDFAVRPGGELDEIVGLVETAGPDIERSRALTKYDRLRTRIGSWFGEEDAVQALRTAYVAKIASDVRNELTRRIGRIDPAKQAALHSYLEVDGSREMLVLSRYLDLVDQADVASAEAVVDTERVQQLLDYVYEASFHPWHTIADAISVRLRAAYPELHRYLGEATPPWERLEHPENAVQWLYAISSNTRDPGTGTNMAAMPAGTRRLVTHTLKERGLWLA